MPPKNFRKIYHLDQDISLYLSNFSKEVSQLTYRKISHPELEISPILSNFTKEVSQLTD